MDPYEKYQLTNFQNWAFFVDDPAINPIKIRNCLKKLDTHPALELEITDNKVRYVWSTENNYNIAPIDALRNELSDIIKIKKFTHGRNIAWCDACYKFNVCRLNEGQIDEKFVVVFGKWEKQIDQGRAGLVLFAVGLGGFYTLPLVQVAVISSAGVKIAFEAYYGKNTIEFNPKENIEEGLKAGIQGGISHLLGNWIWTLFKGS